MVGTVTADGEPIILLSLAGKTWTTIVDTGFNGDLELPETLRASVNARYLGPIISNLAGGQVITEDSYLVDFLFDGRIVEAEATFVPGDNILLGTQLLIGHYRLEINFATGTVLLERVH